jgi:dihydropteroate synthase
MKLFCRNTVLDLTEPVVMGVLNVTPDSFSDGGSYPDCDAALDRALAMAAEGAGIIDVGGESTRPGAAPVSTAEEIDRVVPVIERIVSRSPVTVSVDTSKAPVIAAAVAAGARLINDVRALQRPGAIEAAAASGAGVCLMHMQGEPANMQADPQYDDVVAEVRGFLRRRIEACEAAGIDRERVCVDPGIGFGKRVEHNLTLLRNLRSLADATIPVLVGVSRKSLVGIITGRPLNQRLAGSVAFAALAVAGGAAILRAHDVAATVDAVKVARALQSAVVGGTDR